MKYNAKLFINLNNLLNKDCVVFFYPVDEQLKYGLRTCVVVWTHCLNLNW